MPIQVICPGCHTRFNVGDQHAGKTGACPKCKGSIQIPELGDEIVIHEAELEAGAKDSKGRSVLKPIKRKEAKFSLNIFAIVAGLTLNSRATSRFAWPCDTRSLAWATCWRERRLGRPSRLPRAFADASPALVRSEINDRSNCANAPSI